MEVARDTVRVLAGRTAHTNENVDQLVDVTGEGTMALMDTSSTYSFLRRPNTDKRPLPRSVKTRTRQPHALPDEQLGQLQV